MRLHQLLQESFDPTAIYLHGGPGALEGAGFRRYMRSGGDSGGIFFIKESPVGYRYAAGYASTKPDGVVWRVKLHVRPNEVFDFSNAKHRALAKKNLSAQEFSYWLEAARENHLDWAVLDEDMLDEWGFKGALLFERPKGFDNFDEHAISIGVFDASVIEIIDSISLREAHERGGASS